MEQDRGGTGEETGGVYERGADGSLRPAKPVEYGNPFSAAAIVRWLGFAIVAVVVIAAMCSIVSCTGTRHVDVERDAFVNGTPAHPSLYDEMKTDLVDCFRAQYVADTSIHLEQPIRSDVPLDSIVREWYIVDNADDLPKYCVRENGEAASACWDNEHKRIALARPALASWTLPLHEMGHAVQGYFQIPGEKGGTGAQPESHGPKFTHCTQPS